MARLNSPDGKLVVDLNASDNSLGEADRSAVEQAIGRVFMAISSVQTNVLEAIVALTGESHADHFRSEFVKSTPSLIDLTRRMIKLTSRKIPPSPERDYLISELEWLCNRSEEFWSLRNDLSHGSIYVHGNSGKWAVSRPWSRGEGYQDGRKFILPSEIEKFHRRVWRLIGAILGVIMIPMGRMGPGSQMVLSRFSGPSGWFVTVLIPPGGPPPREPRPANPDAAPPESS